MVVMDPLMHRGLYLGANLWHKWHGQPLSVAWPVREEIGSTAADKVGSRKKSRKSDKEYTAGNRKQGNL